MYCKAEIERDKLIEKIAAYRVDECPIEDIVDYFYRAQVQILEDLSDDELLYIEKECQ